jgi:enoyl-CoA hydratase/carnithine racemase
MTCVALRLGVVGTWPEAGLPTAMEWEMQSLARLFSNRDKHEGMQAFLEKRRPQFQGE